MKGTELLITALLLISLSSSAAVAQDNDGEKKPDQGPAAASTEAPGTTSDDEDFSTFRQVQPEVIHLTLVDFHNYEFVKLVQEQMYSIPGLTDFIPYMETKGLLTYDLRYSGTARLLMKALKDTMGQKYEIGLKEIGTKAWEITMRKLGKPV